MLFILLLSLFIEENRGLVDSTLQYLWKEDYKRVVESINAIEEKAPRKDPLPNLLRIMFLFQYLQDFTQMDSEGIFLKNIEEGIKKSDALSLSSDKKEKLWGAFSKASALSYSAMWLADKGDYLGAILKGIDAVNLFTLCIKNGFELEDAYLALGIYNYGVSVLQKYLGKVFIRGDRREQGINEIKRAYRKGVFLKPLSADALIFIYIREKKRKSALKIARELVEAYPDSRTFQWTLASAYRSLGLWESAREVYYKLYKKIEEEQPNAYYSRALVRYWLSQANYVMNDNKRAKEWLKNIDVLIQKSNWHKKEQLKKRVDNLRKTIKLAEE